jgi:hypothetical protein
MIWAAGHGINSTPAASQDVAEPEDRLHDYGRRWDGGSGLPCQREKLATSWNRLWCELIKFG